MQIDLQVLFKHSDDALGLTGPQYAVVHKHARELFTDRFVQKNSRHG